MKTRNWVMTGIGFIVGIAALSAPTSSEAGINLGIGILIHDGSGSRSRDAYEVGNSNGYADGRIHGERDGDHGANFDFSHDSKYRCGDAGYIRWYGSRRAYVAGYRRGYERGYREAYYASRRHHRHNRGYWGDRDRDNDDDDRTIYEEPRE